MSEITDSPGIAGNTDRPAIAPLTRLLGFAGLLPQAALVLIEAVAGRKPEDWNANLLAGSAAMATLIYGVLILSFLGGMWWGLAMRRTGKAQGRMATLAVVPTLAAAALLGAGLGRDLGWALVALGSAILLTLPVDRHLARTGDAPDGWMRLRIPLSVGLGVLTIIAGILTPQH